MTMQIHTRKSSANLQATPKGEQYPLLRCPQLACNPDAAAQQRDGALLSLLSVQSTTSLGAAASAANQTQQCSYSHLAAVSCSCTARAHSHTQQPIQAMPASPAVQQAPRVAQ
jgi:hypothetical protein